MRARHVAERESETILTLTSLRPDFLMEMSNRMPTPTAVPTLAKLPAHEEPESPPLSPVPAPIESLMSAMRAKSGKFPYILISLGSPTAIYYWPPVAARRTYGGGAGALGSPRAAPVAPPEMSLSQRESETILTLTSLRPDSLMEMSNRMPTPFVL